MRSKIKIVVEVKISQFLRENRTISDMTIHDVARAMGCGSDLIEAFEEGNIPVCELVKMVEILQIPIPKFYEFLDELQSEVHRIRLSHR